MKKILTRGIASSLTLLAMTGWALTSFAQTAAPRPGTDDYLRNVLGVSAESLQTPVASEGRQPFDLATTLGPIEDPLGDVLDRFGTTSSVGAAYGDIESAVITKNATAQTWDVQVTLGGIVPAKPEDKAEFFFLADIDNVTDNNAPTGTRIGTDAEFAMQYNKDAGWYSDFRWYNKDADFWAVNKETQSTFEITGNTVTYHVPFAELPATWTPAWRVVMAVTNGSDSQIDAAPTVGFPAVSPTEQTATTPVSVAGVAGVWILYALLASAIIIAIFYAIRFARRRKTEPRA